MLNRKSTGKCYSNNRFKAVKYLFFLCLMVIFIVLIKGSWSTDRQQIISVEKTETKQHVAPNDRDISRPIKRSISSDFYFHPYHRRSKSYTPSRLHRPNYSSHLFRSIKDVPILWLDKHGDARWNEAAEQEMYHHLLEKQTIQAKSDESIIEQCLRRQLLILIQHEAGFFSRHNCFIDQFGQTLYSPSMVLLSYRAFHVSNSGKEDFRREGVLRYFVPISTCSALDRNPKMKPIFDRLNGDVRYTKKVTKIDDLLYENQRRSNAKYIWYDNFWEYGHEHIPHRRWLLDVNRTFTPIDYSMTLNELMNHDDEHIYADPSLSDKYLEEWREPFGPFGQPSTFFGGPSYRLTWKDRVFTSFTRCMAMLYFHHFPSRIYRSVQLLYEHWSNYFLDKSGQTLDDMAAIFIRRGDKMPEDSFWIKHKRWRNISYYVKGLVDEETRRNRRYSSVFIMTDDASVMSSIQDYADPQSRGTDEQYARQHLKGRNILNNVFAPQSCFNPFIRIGFDQFLVTLEFLLRYTDVVVGHTDSNVGYYIYHHLYCRRQQDHSRGSRSFVVNAPDSL